MNKIIYTLLLSLMVGMSLQAQDAIRYQAVAFDAAGSLVKSSEVAILFTIVKGDASGAFSYIESHKPTTDDEGSFEVEIGNGTPVAGDFSDVNWGSDSHFLEVSIDPDGGNDYVLAGITEFLSVPYTLHAKNALYGPRGPQGVRGIQGAQGPDGVKGVNGIDQVTFYDCWDTNFNGINDANEDTNFDGKLDALDCQGEEGFQGLQGVQGEPGERGPQGLAGPIGIKGERGPKGFTGIPGEGGGMRGIQGIQGERGVQGEQGPQGERGIQGIQGGPEGPQGDVGPRGVPGDPNGPQGVQGETGDRGPQGAQGPQGRQGEFGDDALPIQVILSTVPSAPALHDIYLDDGSNRIDGELGFRYYNGTQWIDLY